jgi:hypothetical protein
MVITTFYYRLEDKIQVLKDFAEIKKKILEKKDTKILGEILPLKSKSLNLK